MAYYTSSTYLVRYIITGNATGAAAAMQKTSTEAELAGAKISRVGKSITGFGRSMLLASLPLAGLGTIAFKAASDFTQAMTRVRSQGLATQGEATNAAKALLAMTGQVGFGATDLANSLNIVYRAGFKGAGALNLLKTAAEGAKIGNDTLLNTTMALTSVMNANLRGTKNYAQVMQVLDQAVAHGTLSLTGLTESLGNSAVLGEAKLFHVSLQDIVSVLAALSTIGTKPGRFATNLKFFLDRMAAAATVPKAKKGLSDIGISADQLSEKFQGRGPGQGLLPALGELRAHLRGLSDSARADALTKIFGGSRGLGTASQMLVFLNQILKTNAAIKTASAGQFAQRWALQNATTAQQIADAKSVLQASLIKLGVTITPAIMKIVPVLVTAVQTLVNVFDALPKPIRNSFVYLTVLATVVGTAAIVFGSLFKAISLIVVAFEWFIPLLGVAWTSLVALTTASDAATISLTAQGFDTYALIRAQRAATASTVELTGAMRGLAFTDLLALLPVLAPLLLVAALVVLYYKWKWFHNAVNNTYKFIKNYWKSLKGVLSSPFYQLFVVAKLIVPVIRTIKNLVANNWKPLKSILISPFVQLLFVIRQIIGGIHTIKNLVKSIKSPFKAAEGLSGAIGESSFAPLSIIKSFLRSGGTVRRRREGGMVGGPMFDQAVHRRGGGSMLGGYGGGDIIPLLAEPGEFVLKKEAVASLGPNRVQALNAGFDGGAGGGTITIEPAPVIINLDGRKLAEGVIRYAARRNAIAGGGG